MHADAFYRQPFDERDRLGPALLLAIGLHLLVALVFLLASWFPMWNHDTAAAGGSPAVEASLVISSADVRAAEKAMRDAPEPLPKPVDEPVVEESVPPPQPIPEPRPQDAPTPQQVHAQERVPVPDTQDQEEASRLAISQEKARQEQEAKRRQEQIDLTEERKKQEEVENKRRLAAQQDEADKQAKLAEIRRQRAQLDKQKSLAEQKLRQLADARATQASSAAEAAARADAGASASAPARGAGGAANDTGQWLAAVAAAIERQWIRPDSVSAGVVCPIRIRILPGGEVMSAEVQPSCPYDAKAQESVERAVMKASPLPYSGYSVPGRDIVVRFQASR